MLTLFCPRRLKMLLAKRQSLLILKAVVFVFIFGLYFIVLIKESRNVMENNAKSKTAAASKIDNSHHHKQHVIQKRFHHNYELIKINKHRSTLKSPSSYLIPNPKFHPPEDKSSAINNNSSSNDADSSGAHQSSTLNPIYEYSEEINAQAERDFVQRQKHLWEVCERNQIVGKFTPNAWEFFISPGHQLAWCNVFKAASSTWMYYFNILAGYDIKYLQRSIATPLDLARKRFPRPSLEDLDESLENSISFLIVREPFERLLSAYRNKMENGKNTYYKLLGEQIVKKFRAQPSENPGPTFKEFLQFVIQHYKSGGRFDEHWCPIYQFCTPCSINFTLIAKMETFQRDSDYIIRSAGLETLLFNKVPKSKETKIGNRSNNSTSSLIPKYFSQINQDLLTEILKIYQLDFDLFDYDSSKYKQMVQQSGDEDDGIRKLNNIRNRLDFDVSEPKVFS